MLRKFKHKVCFGGTTKYVVWDTEHLISHLELNDGTIDHDAGFSLVEIIAAVDRGSWIEIKQENDDCSCNRLKSCDEDKKTTGLSKYTQMMTGLSDSQSPIDFSTAQVGDTLRCVLNGDGVLKKLYDFIQYKYCIEISFAGDKDESYTKDGKITLRNINPALLGWVDSNGKLCRTRPEPEIDWSKVKVDTPVEITKTGESEDEVLNFTGREFDGFPVFFRCGMTSHTTTTNNTTYFSGVTYKIINTETKEK